MFSVSSSGQKCGENIGVFRAKIFHGFFTAALIPFLFRCDFRWQFWRFVVCLIIMVAPCLAQLPDGGLFFRETSDMGFEHLVTDLLVQCLGVFLAVGSIELEPLHPFSFAGFAIGHGGALNVATDLRVRVSEHAKTLLDFSDQLDERL